MSKILANEIANYGDDAPIDLKEGLNIPAGKPIQAAGSTGTTGQVLSTTGSTVQWVTPFSGSYTDLTNKPSIPSAQVNADWNASGGISAILNKPVVPPLSSVVTASAGTSALSFNSANGQFTFTPPDLSGYATTTSLTTALTNSSNWDTAYGWGNHASAGYLTAEADTIATVLDRNALSYGNKTVYPIDKYVVHTSRWQFDNDVDFFGIGDGIYVGGMTSGLRWLDRDPADDADFDNFPAGKGSNTNKQTFVMHYMRSPITWMGFTEPNVMYMQTKPNGSGEATKLSIGNDDGIIQLGNNASTTAYLQASSTATKLFHNGSEVLTTTATGVDLGSNNLVTTGKLLYSNNYANLADLPSATTYHGMFAHVHAEGHGYFAHGGAWAQLLDEGSSIDDLADVDTTTVAPQNGQVLKWNGANWAPANDLTGGGGGGLALTDLSASTATASGGGAFAYNNGTGVFTYTPPDLSNYDTAYGWGDHSTEGYITSIGDAIQDADFTSNGLMKRTAAGTYTSTTDNSSNWDTAFGWGDHGSQGYLTSLPAHGIGNHSDVTVTSPQDNQLLKYNNSLAQWENWTANYLTSESDTLQSVIARGGTVSSGSPSFGTNVFFTGTGTGAGNGGAPYILWDKTNNDLLFSDDTKIALGYSGDLKIYHFTAGSGTNYISAFNNTEIVVSSDVVNLMNQNHSGWYFKGEASGSIVYHNNTARLTTTSSGVTLSGALTAGGLTYPTSNGNSGQILTSDGAGNVTWQDGGSGNTQVSISDTVPAGSASAGDLWWESDTGRLKIYYQDVDSAQWVDVNAPLRQDRIASTGAPSSATDTGVAGDIRYDSNYVYIAVGTNTWKRAALTTW
tara:strand:+ start:133 stop:2676 length:2544 start_codon:yes stop_codon:yes gene_type:complete